MGLILSLMLDSKGFIPFNSIQAKVKLFIDDQIKKTPNTLYIKLLNVILAIV